MEKNRVKNTSYLYFDSFNEWLSSFPPKWIEYIYHDSHYPIVKLKECVVIHQTYGLPGRNAVDEEYFLISPNNKILEYSSVYSKYKGIDGSFFHALVSRKINPWKSVDVALENNMPIYFHAAKPNYGHTILDCLPDILATSNYIIKNNGRIYTGVNPDKSLIDAISISERKLIDYCIPPEMHGWPTKGTWRSFKVKNLILPPHRSRTEKVDYLKKHFIPNIRDFQQAEGLERKKNICIQRATKGRISIDKLMEKDLDLLGFHKIDATQLSLKESFSYFSRAEKIIISFGAETANLIFSENALIYLLVDAKKMVEPLYLNALTDTVLSISNSRINIIPLESEGETINSSSLADSRLLLSSTDFLK